MVIARFNINIKEKQIRIHEGQEEIGEVIEVEYLKNKTSQKTFQHRFESHWKTVVHEYEQK